MANIYPNIIQLPQYGLTLQGKIRGTEYPGLIIPELKLLFNATIKPFFDVEFLLLSHTHMDQCVSLSGKMSNRTSPIVVSPLANVSSLIDYVNATAKFKYTLYQSDTTNINSKFIGVKNEDTIPIRPNLYIKTYDLDHVIPCCGYGLYIIRTVLKKEHVGITRKEIIKLRREGVQLSEIVHEPIIVYVSETLVSVFDKYPELFNYLYIIIECTYLPIKEDDIDEEVQQSISHKQIHWTTIYPIIQSHPQNTFIICCFNPKYSDNDLDRFKEKITDKNIIFVM
jgi:ribonuclease Z